MIRRAWVEINKKILAENMQFARRQTNAKIMAMVKANGYGHGDVEVARTFLENGASYLGVACADEVKKLRENGITAPILIAGSITKEELESAISYHAILSVSSLAEAAEIDRVSALQDKITTVHMKVDTGMTRNGFRMDAVLEAKKVFALPHIHVEGIFTHMACADDPDETITRRQFALFTEFCDALGEPNLLKHVCNSAATFRFPEMHCDMVRLGICLYGNNPLPWKTDMPNIRESLTLRASVSRVCTVPAGTKIGYNGTFTAEKPMQVATVLIGYGDGLSRALSNRGEVIIKGKRVPIVGRICMDQLMVDVSDMEVSPGEIATIRGEADGAVITTEESAKLLNTISYELYCTVGERIPRYYV